MKLYRVLQTLSVLIVFGNFTVLMCQTTNSTSSLFPLHIGNQWSYSAREFPSSHIVHSTVRISDTATMNGRFYYIMSRDSVVTTPNRTGYRCSNDTVYMLMYPMDNTETPVYYLKAKVGDTLHVESNYACIYGASTILAGKEDTVRTPSATFLHAYHFTFERVCDDAGMIDAWLAPGIGDVMHVVDNIAGALFFTLDSSIILTTVNHVGGDRTASSHLELECYPNPFNPQTTITYQLQRGSHVSIAIFDLLGRKIIQLVNEFKTAGIYHISWNAKDMASGAYFAVLKTGDYSMTRRLVLQK